MEKESEKVDRGSHKKVCHLFSLSLSLYYLLFSFLFPRISFFLICDMPAASLKRERE
jgi:hypothetical protein